MEIRLRDRSNKVRYEFRRVAREVTHEMYDVPEDNQVLIAYQPERQTRGPSQIMEQTQHTQHKSRSGGGRTLQVACGALSFSLADPSMAEAGSMFDSSFYNMITFLFVKPDHQRKGVGRQLIQAALKQMAAHEPSRPVRVESALGAAYFFEKLGFVRVSSPYETVCSGARLFRSIVNMEHEAPRCDP
ncbi:uncharacterized protein LOC124274505 [Haliotis rubra]|uniref:uncharacterized protein LOC124274505 n=1 Tax=Haliotis rubra TaxID=36100 RepID=UPI001EE5C22E|nr:uncharacterized protein LOC124274505 [Haliotis rubra]XP_046565826.1 uncharacterized protein LOC124274505 [Haliotis rubra]